MTKPIETGEPLCLGLNFTLLNYLTLISLQFATRAQVPQL